MVRVLKVSIGRNGTDEGRTSQTASIAAATFPFIGEIEDSVVGNNVFLKTHVFAAFNFLQNNRTITR